jgi:hypothetical protein
MEFLSPCQKHTSPGQYGMQMVAVTYFRAEADSRITIFYAAGNETDITFLIMIIFDAAIVTVPLRRVNCFHEPALPKRCKIR